MTGLSKPSDPSLSRKIKRKLFLAVLAGSSLAYLAILIAAMVAKELLK